jgi:tetratricopeptide (TPR) repeat protein
MSSVYRFTMGVGTVIALVTGAPAVSAQPSPSSSQQHSSPIQRLFSQGQEKARQGDYEGAIADFTLALRSNPKFTDAYIQRGIAHHDLGNFRNALVDFNQALKIMPNHATALYNRAEARFEAGDVHGAISDYNRSIQLAPKRPESYNQRAIVFASVGDRQRSLADFNQAIRLRPTYADAYYNRGKMRTELGDQRGAISDYNRAVYFNPKMAEAYGNRGLLRYQFLDDKQAGLLDLQYAAHLFIQQGNQEGYQQTIIYIEQMQQNSLLPKPEQGLADFDTALNSSMSRTVARG